MNKKFIFLSCLLLCCLLGFTAATKDQKLISLPEKETFVYKAKFLGISIGKFIITNNGKTVLNGREVYCFELKVKALPFFLKAFKAKARYVSYMDAQSFVVVRHEEYIKSGKLMESAVDFDYKAHTATYTNSIDGRTATVKIPDKLHDILTGGFYLRMIPLGLGDTVELNIYADEKIYNYTGLISEKTKVNLPDYPKQDAYYFKPSLFLDGKQIKKISAEVYFSTTAPTKTMRATLDSRFGKVHVVLVEGYKTP